MNLTVAFRLNKIGVDDETLCGESVDDVGYCALDKRKINGSPLTLSAVSLRREWWRSHEAMKTYYLHTFVTTLIFTLTYHIHAATFKDALLIIFLLCLTT